MNSNGHKLEKVNTLHAEIRAVLEQARFSAYRAVNFAMVQAYWQVGYLIVEHEQSGKKRAEYGKAILKEISNRLTGEFGKGFDITNLRKMRQFYLMFSKRDAVSLKSDKPKRDAVRLESGEAIKSSAVRSELTWTHYRHLYYLKCFVLIDLKIGELTHQDIGQMDGYVRMYEDLFKVKDDNPTIELILCSKKNEAIARYSVLNNSKQLFASKYMLYLPTEEELEQELERERRLIEENRLQKNDDGGTSKQLSQ